MTSEKEYLKLKIDLQGIYYTLAVGLAFCISLFSGIMVTFHLCLYDHL